MERSPQRLEQIEAILAEHEIASPGASRGTVSVLTRLETPPRLTGLGLQAAEIRTVPRAGYTRLPEWLRALEELRRGYPAR